jgi:hypothetical protein
MDVGTEWHEVFRSLTALAWVMLIHTGKPPDDKDL